MALNIIMTENRAKELLAALAKAKKVALTAVGVQAVGDIQLRAPVDTGRLKNSFTYRVPDESTLVIGTAVSYAIYQEFGTSKMKHWKGPYMRPALTQNQEVYKEIIKKYLSGKA